MDPAKDKALYEEALKLQSERNSADCISEVPNSALYKDICRDERSSKCFSNPLVKARILNNINNYTQGSANVYGFLFGVDQQLGRRWIAIAEWCWSHFETVVGETVTKELEYVMDNFAAMPQLYTIPTFVTTEFCLFTNKCTERFASEDLCRLFFAALGLAEDVDSMEKWYPFVVHSMVAAICTIIGPLTDETFTSQDKTNLMRANHLAISILFVDVLESLKSEHPSVVDLQQRTHSLHHLVRTT